MEQGGKGVRKLREQGHRNSEQGILGAGIHFPTSLLPHFPLHHERKLRQACHRAKQVVVYAYGGRKAENWWKDIASAKRDLPKNLTVYNLAPEATRALGEFAKGDLKLNVVVQDGEMSVGDGEKSAQVEIVKMNKY